MASAPSSATAAPKTTGEPPPNLYVVSPNGQHMLGGEYVLQYEKVNGLPVWKQEGGFWLFSGTDGKWNIGDSKAREKGFQCSGGMIYCKVPHHGVMPDRLRSIWLRYAGGSFMEDSDISVTSGLDRPHAISVIQNKHPTVFPWVGQYARCTGISIRGLPIWKQKGGTHWLYAGNNKRWVIGTDKAREKNFESSTGLVCSSKYHGGIMPDKMPGPWMRVNTKKEYFEDSAILVARPPKSTLYVRTPNGQQLCAGEYKPVQGVEVNGHCVWANTRNEGFWLSSSSNGTWKIGEDYNSNKGLILCKATHMGVPPDRVDGPWLRREGKISAEDPAISVSATPSSLWLVSPKGPQGCIGEYRQTDEVLNGFPVWRQEQHAAQHYGRHWLFSNSHGAWAIGGNEHKEGVTEESGILVSTCTHAGRNPDKVAGSWARATSSGLEKDVGIVVAAFLFRPSRLYVTSPNGQKKCAGEYVLAPGEANGQPHWQHAEGRYWLYSGVNGMWNIGGNSVKEQNFKCRIAVIFSGCMHGGLMPDKATSKWQRLGPDTTFLEDPEIVVSARPPLADPSL